MTKVKVGVIGTGGIAEKHLEVLNAFDDVEVAALCNSGNPRIKGLAERFGIGKTFSDYRKLLDVVEIDAVLVLVSVLRLPEVTRECLKRGIPTLLEKPPGLSVVETQSLLECATTTQCINMVALNRRFYSVMQNARASILEAGPLVSVLVEAPERVPDYIAAGHPPEVIKQIIFANGIHCIDMLRYFGGDVASVAASATKWFANQDDSFNALLRFENGATGHYLSNWTTPGRWSVTLYGKSRRITLCPLEKGIVLEADGRESALPVAEVDQLYKPGFYAQNRFFIDRVKDKDSIGYPAADLADALKTMKLIEQIQAHSE